MRFLRGKSSPADTGTGPDAAVEVSAPTPDGVEPARPPGKGRPTPSRREAEGRRRGPAPPPPKNQREALRRMRSTKQERREASATRRQRMLAGDEKYLLPRDRGADKAYTRDIVDSRRSLMSLFMPLALVILVVIFIPSPALAQFTSLLTTAMLLTMLVEGFLLGRLVNRKVRERYPETTASKLGLGFYAFTRATQIRRLRVPKPRYSPAAPVDA